MSAKKLGDVCGFCRRGGEVENVCGPLHTDKTTDDKVVAAHHKCMQYSALLTQYKFEHFGGFKIDKVQSEMYRGRSLKCHICAKGRTKKSGDSASKRGATSGCAVKTCRKTFHYYCAAGNEQVITKRLVVNFKHKAKKAVLYRVFCSEEHKQQYLTDIKSEKERETLLNDGDDSDISDEDEDEEIPDRSRPHDESSSQREDVYLDQDTSYIQLGTPQAVLSNSPHRQLVSPKASPDKLGTSLTSPQQQIVYPVVKAIRADQATLQSNGGVLSKVGSEVPLDRQTSSDHAYVKIRTPVDQHRESKSKPIDPDRETKKKKVPTATLR